MSFKFSLPLPPAGCSSNKESGRHWVERHRARKDYRSAGFAFCYQAIRIAFNPTMRVDMVLNGDAKQKHFCRKVKISSEWFLGRNLPNDGRYRPRDVGNAISALKAAVDGFVDAKLVPDDSSRHVDWGTCVLHSAKESGKRAEVVITIEVLE